MEVTSVQAGTTSTASSQATQQLGKEDFLLLLVTQLQNQDPLDPLDTGEYTNQLMQMGSLEQLQQLNGSVESLADSSSLLGATDLVGKQVSYLDSSNVLQSGVVEQVVLVDGSVQLSVGGTAINLDALQAIGS